MQDIAEIRTMMERSSRFLSLSGWAGIMAGIYALAGVWVAVSILGFHPNRMVYHFGTASERLQLLGLGAVVMVLAISTAMLLSSRKAKSKGENGWNATSRRLLFNMGVPLVAGGVLILILFQNELAGLVIPCTLVFYGLALFNASKYTLDEVRYMGLIQTGLGLLAAGFIEFSVILWAVGFGLVHIGYGIYIYFKYDK